MSTALSSSNVSKFSEGTEPELRVGNQALQSNGNQSTNDSSVNATTTALRDSQDPGVGEQPHELPGDAMDLVKAAPGDMPAVDMAEFFSIDNLEISKDKNGKTIVDGVPVEEPALSKDATNESTDLHTPAKPRAKSETLDSMTVVQRPRLETKSVPQSPFIRPGSADKTSTLQSITNSPHKNSGTDAPRVSAYARLDFEKFSFYVQTLQVILGRRPENGESMVDVDLGVAKAISRRHANLFYNFGTQRFELNVLGRNGAFVNDTFFDKGSTIPLKNE